MIKIERTDSHHPDFRHLVFLLDKFLKIKDGEEHSFYAAFNKLDSIKNVILCYDGLNIIGCGAFKKFNSTTVEIKRMFVLQNFRQKGIGTLIIKELELWALELKFTEAILETGKKQTEAILLYKKAGYALISNYGQYKNAANSVCMKKNLSIG